MFFLLFKKLQFNLQNTIFMDLGLDSTRRRHILKEKVAPVLYYLFSQNDISTSSVFPTDIFPIRDIK